MSRPFPEHVNPQEVSTKPVIIYYNNPNAQNYSIVLALNLASESFADPPPGVRHVADAA